MGTTAGSSAILRSARGASNAPLRSFPSASTKCVRVEDAGNHLATWSRAQAADSFAWQPLHAFDGAKLNGALNVRRANAGETFAALDGKSYPLSTEHLVIADGASAVAIAGVMGGAESGVTDSTQVVWLESALFQPQSVRRTSRVLGLSSDSSYRFERGIDLDGILYASQRATELIVELAGGAAGPIRDGYSPSFKESTSDSIEGDIHFGDKPSDQHSHSVELRPSRLSALLGVEVPESEVHDILTRLGLAFGPFDRGQVPICGDPIDRRRAEVVIHHRIGDRAVRRVFLLVRENHDPQVQVGHEHRP